MGKKTSTPKSPDPIATANAQTQSNKQTAEFNADLNRINEYTPLGNLTYTKTGGFDQAGYDSAMSAYQQQLAAARSLQAPQPSAYGDGRSGTTSRVGVSRNLQMPVAPNRADFETAPEYSRTVSLSPEVQRVFDAQMGNDAQLAELAGSRMGAVSSALSQPLPSVNQDEVMAAMLSRLEPDFQRDEERLRTRLANMGGADATANPEMFGREMDVLARARNDARMQALLGANQYAGQSLSNAIMERTQPLNEVLAMKNGTQLALPQFSSTPQSAAPGTDVAGTIMQDYQNRVGANNAKIAQQNSILNGLFGLGAAGIMAL